MRVLVACEYSGRVRSAFAKRGWDAWSCDLLPSETPGQHHQGDVKDMLVQQWDLLIAHPPCTYLSVSGMHWTVRGLRDPQLTEDALEFVRLLLDANVQSIALENPVSVISSRIRKPDQIVQPWHYGEDASKKTCLWLKGLPKLEIDPLKVCPPRGWEHVYHTIDMIECDDCGEPYCQKHGLHYADCPSIGPMEDEVEMKLIDGVMFATRDSPPPKMLWGNQTPSAQNKIGPSPDRWKERSRTYEGIANAMADQWGRWVENKIRT